MDREDGDFQTEIELFEQEKFELQNNGIFRVPSKSFRSDENISNLIKKYGIIDAQKYCNHMHLGVYGDLSDQRRLAWIIIEIIRRKVANLNATSTCLAELKDDEFEVEITFWLES